MARIRFALVAAFLLSLVAPVQADVADVAQLFPATTLAYAELHKPADLGPELAAVFKGSGLEDSLKFVHDRRDKTKDARDLMGRDEFGLLGVLAAPEMLGEFRKLHGVAVGLTGFNERHDPEVALAVLTGDSQAAGLAVRALLTVSPAVRRVGVASGVPVFQIRRTSVSYNQNGQPEPANEKPVSEGTGELTVAYTPGLLAVGSSRLAVADLIARFKGEKKEPLAGNVGFREAVAQSRQPGLFWYVNPNELCTRLDAAKKGSGEHVDSDGYAYLKLLAKPKSIRRASGCLRFRDKGLSLTAEVNLEPGAGSPLLTLLGGTEPVAAEFRTLPGGFTLGLSIALPKTDRPAAVLGFLDSLAKAAGTLGRMPSQAEKEIAAKYKLAIGDSLIARTRAASVVVPTRQELPPGVLQLPLLVLQADDIATAARWGDAVRAVVADLTGAEALPSPSSEVLEGVKVFSLAGTGLPWKAPVHFAAEGTTFVVGLDRKLVAAAAKNRVATPGGTELRDAVVIGSFSFAGAIRKYVTPAPKNETEGAVRVIDGPVQFNGRHQRGGNGEPQPDPELVKQAAKAKEEFLTTFEAMPLARGSVRRTETGLRIEWFQADVQGGLTRSIDKALAWLDRVTAAIPGRDGESRGVLFEK